MKEEKHEIRKLKKLEEAIILAFLLVKVNNQLSKLVAINPLLTDQLIY